MARSFLCSGPASICATARSARTGRIESCSPAAGSSPAPGGVFWYPKGEALDLLRVSQYVAVRVRRPGPLYDELRELFAGDYAPTRSTASSPRCPAPCRERGTPHAPARSSRRTTTTRSSGRSTTQASRTTSSRTSPTASTAASSSHRPPDGEPRLIEQPERVRRARARRADGDPEDPRRGRPRRRPSATAT